MHLFGGENLEWTVTEQGPKVVIEVWQEDKGDGLYKAYLSGPWGSCLLGTLVPENGKLFLRRTLSVDSLRRQGVWPVRRVECRMAHRFQQEGASIPWADEILRRCARNLPRHTVYRDGEGLSLVTRFDPRLPFPMPPLFCFGRVENGRLIFSFRADGTPYIFRPEGKNREESKEQKE